MPALRVGQETRVAAKSEETPSVEELLRLVAGGWKLVVFRGDSPFLESLRGAALGGKAATRLLPESKAPGRVPLRKEGKEK